jgi:tetratricopeptide (TPR) repeat protein
MLEYDTGEYVKALADIEQAYEIDPRPALLFNVGQCQRALGHYREAGLAFKAYLREVPSAHDRGHVETLVAEMEKLAQQALAAQKPAPPAPILILPASPSPVAPAPAPAPVAAPKPPPRAAPLPAAPAAAVTEPAAKGHIPAGAWWLGGVGLGVAVVGTILFAVAESALSGDDATLKNGNTLHQIPASSFYSAATMGNVGEAMWAIGGAGLVGGGIWAGVGSSK